MSKKRSIEEIPKTEKISYLRMNGWFELKTKNNWINGTNVPKNWKGLNLEDAFENFYLKNKKKIA